MCAMKKYIRSIVIVAIVIFLFTGIVSAIETGNASKDNESILGNISLEKSSVSKPLLSNQSDFERVKKNTLSPTAPVNASSDTHYFITIDPIGNHSVNDVFFVNGTTNLPAGDILLVQGYNSIFQPGPMVGSYIIAYISVEPGYAGMNIWSCNLSPILWNTWVNSPTGPSHDIRHFIESDSYIISIWANRSPNDINAFSNYFTISSVELGALPAVSQTSIAPETTTILPSPSSVTVNTTQIPPTPSVPLSGIVSVAALTTMAIVWSVNKRRQG